MLPHCVDKNYFLAKLRREEIEEDNKAAARVAEREYEIEMALRERELAERKHWNSLLRNAKMILRNYRRKTVNDSLRQKYKKLISWIVNRCLARVSSTENQDVVATIQGRMTT